LLAVPLFLGLWLASLRRRLPPVRTHRRASFPPELQQLQRFNPKPPWVRKEVIRLRALMPLAGCRTISLTFNHLWRQRRDMMTVGKSFVANVVPESQHEILIARRRIRSRKPRAMPPNLAWALDLTFLPEGEKPPAVLGIVDHGTRLCVAMCHLERRTSIAVLRVLLDAIEHLGRPRVLRTDNEALFTSRLFRFCLAILGIRHQRSAPFAPWQNGRIERFFGTFKRCLREFYQLQPDTTLSDSQLDTFRGWYNHIRPHQNLAGQTPAEAWTGRTVNRKKAPQFVSAWYGALTGFIWPP
jgi:putative transposase